RRHTSVSRAWSSDVCSSDLMIRCLLRRPPADIDPGHWQTLQATVPWVAALDEARGERLRQLSARFLHDKTITPVAGLVLDDVARSEERRVGKRGSRRHTSTA